MAGRLRAVVLTVFMHAHVLLRISAYDGTAVLVHFLPVKSRKRLARDIMYISAKHADCVRDITELVKMIALPAMFPRLSHVDF